MVAPNWPDTWSLAVLAKSAKSPTRAPRASSDCHSVRAGFLGHEEGNTLADSFGTSKAVPWHEQGADLTLQHRHLSAQNTEFFGLGAEAGATVLRLALRLALQFVDSTSSSPNENQQRPVYQRPLENELDVGVYNYLRALALALARRRICTQSPNKYSDESSEAKDLSRGFSNHLHCPVT
ncbi:hypothetical protein Scep_004981 [Stephania cephalantha]|uniref:Uncharacterized protein n=1 Tax=Stephania cephalantha TaxID=152367 RepID=A0AAP0PVX3_9MAGN